MRIKQIVAITFMTCGGGLVLILLAGLVLPSSFLQSLSRNTQQSAAQKASQSGNKSATQLATTQNSGSGAEASGTQATGGGTAPTGTAQTPSGSKSATGGTPSSGGTNTTGGSTTGTGGSGTGTGGGTGTGTGTGGGTTQPPTTISSFTVSPTSIAYQASATLNWAASNATSCSIFPTIGTVSSSGSHSTGTLSSSATYTLSCSGNGSVSKQVSVTVAAAPPACGQAGGTCSAAQVAAHNNQGDCWMIYGGKWYVVTSYVNSHPGGRSSFNSSTCGVDVTAYMNGSASAAGQRHTHSQSAYNTLTSFTGGLMQ